MIEENYIDDKTAIEAVPAENASGGENLKEEQKKSKPATEKRIKSIDRFRGFCVFAMLIFQFLKNFPALGFVSKLANHNINQGIVILPGMTLADIIAPAFIFAVGLTFALAFNKYKNLHGRKQAYIRYGLRALSIIGVGGILETVNKVLDVLGGGSLGIVDIIFCALTGLAVLAIIFKCICALPKMPNKIKAISTWTLYAALALAGVMTLTVALIDFINLSSDINAARYGYWVTLQDIGMACLIALPLVEAKKWVKFLVASLIFVGFSVYHQIGNHQVLLDIIPHGGFLGGFGWGAMLIFDLFVADLFNGENKWKYLSAVSLFTVAGIWSTMFLGNINLGSCSPAFILVSVGLSGLIFEVFYLFDKLPHPKFDILLWWGKNPLIMFLVEFFVIGAFNEFAPASMLANASLGLAIAEGVAAIVILTTIAWLLSRKRKSISL